MTQYQLLRADEEQGVLVVTVLTPELRADAVILRLEHELDSLIAAKGARQLILDMAPVHFLSSGGLRALIVLRKRLKELGGRFTMCGVHPYVADVFKTTRLFSEKFDYLPDVTSAIAALKEAPA
jgi:anti-anti-sigma factor